MANVKPQLKYRVVNGYNPKTRGTCKRPQITERETYYLDQVVQFALDNGFVRGQFQDMKGALNGFIECIQYLGLNGKAVSLNDWLRVHSELTGTVGEDYQLSPSNELRVCIQALKELKTSADNFSWTNIDDRSLIMKVESITSPNGIKDEIIKTKAIVANGKNLSFNAAWGDKVIVTWKQGEEEMSTELVPSEQSETYLRFDWPTALADVPVDTVLTFSFRLHAGEGAAEQSSTRSATLIAAS